MAAMSEQAACDHTNGGAKASQAQDTEQGRSPLKKRGRGSSSGAEAGITAKDVVVSSDALHTHLHDRACNLAPL